MRLEVRVVDEHVATETAVDFFNDLIIQLLEIM